jgi:flagellar biosynthesis/type III secretory pathway protein FliH
MIFREKNEHLRTFLVAQLVYILKINEFSPENTTKIIQSIKNSDNMSAYDYLIKETQVEWLEKGIEKGIDLGIEKGIDLGIEKGIDLGIEKGIDLGIEKGIDLGIEKGMDLGIEKGATLKEKDFTTSLILSTDFDDAKIAALVGVTEEYVTDLRKALVA